MDIDLYYNNQKVPTAEVKLNYTVTGGISKAYVFTTTFSDSFCDSKCEERLDEIQKYLSNIEYK